MAREFHVEPDALYEFSGLVYRYGDHADFLRNYTTGNPFELDTKGAGINSALSIAIPFHIVVWSMARERLQAMADLAHKGSEGVTNAGKFYEVTDREQAERLDRTYPDTLPSQLPPPTVSVDPPKKETPDPTREFTEPEDPVTEMFALQLDDLGDDLTPKASKIAEFQEKLSAVYWIRKLLKQAIGWDPLEEVVILFTGDWRKWAEAAKGWRRIGECVYSMTGNLGRYRSLDYYWGGEAADAAMAYFYRFERGSEQETELYREWIFPKYKDIMEIIYSQYKILETLVAGLIDAALSMAGDLMRGEKPNRIKLLIELAKVILETVLASYPAVAAAAKIEDTGDLPFSTIQEMADSTSADYPGGYRHPDGRSNTGSLPPGYEIRPA